jgi:hypothetical protein
MCPKSKKKIMKALDKKDRKVNFKGVVKEIKEIERGLKFMLGDFREKLEKLKNEKAKLLKEIEELKRIGESRARNLEEEIASLRDEVESLKEMLNENK